MTQVAVDEDGVTLVGRIWPKEFYDGEGSMFGGYLDVPCCRFVSVHWPNICKLIENAASQNIFEKKQEEGLAKWKPNATRETRSLFFATFISFL